MLAGGIVEPGGGSPGAVVAFVAVAGGPTGSRMFKVEGPADAPRVAELPPETTIDLGRMQRDVASELQPALDAIAALGGKAAITVPAAAWVCDVLRRHLEETEDVVLD
jgi:hypothetical protein